MPDIKKSHQTHVLFFYREIVICMRDCWGDKNKKEINLSAFIGGIAGQNPA
jgi:hypothetical protein